MIEIIGILILGYLLGSIPFALLVGKWGHGIDIRQHGSGNLGTTNTFRVLGKKAGIIVLIGDLGKGAVASLVPILLASELHPLFAGLAAVIGHIYPVFARFKGGKAVATSGGMLLVTSPILFLFLLDFLFDDVTTEPDGFTQLNRCGKHRYRRLDYDRYHRAGLDRPDVLYDSCAVRHL